MPGAGLKLAEWRPFSPSDLLAAIPAAALLVLFGAPLLVAVCVAFVSVAVVAIWQARSRLHQTATAMLHTHHGEITRREVSDAGIKIHGQEATVLDWMGCEAYSLLSLQALVFTDSNLFVSLPRAGVSPEGWRRLVAIISHRLPVFGPADTAESAAANARWQALETIAALLASAECSAAIAACNQALAKHALPHRHAQIYALRGHARVELEQFAEAEADLTRALKVRIVGNDLWFRGVARWMQGKREEAGDDFKGAVDLGPRNVYYLAALAHWHAGQGDPAASAKVLAAMTIAHPDVADWASAVAEATIRGISQRGANRMYGFVLECALLIDPGNKSAREALADLSKSKQPSATEAGQQPTAT